MPIREPAQEGQTLDKLSDQEVFKTIAKEAGELFISLSRIVEGSGLSPQDEYNLERLKALLQDVSKRQKK